MSFFLNNDAKFVTFKLKEKNDSHVREGDVNFIHGIHGPPLLF